VYRAKAFAYDDARGKVTRIADSVGFRDTVGTRYSGLGYVDSTSFVTRRDTATAATVWRTTEGFFTDGLANQVQSFRMSNVANRRLGSTSTTAALRAFAYDTTRLGRLVADTAGDGVTHYEYDPAGNTSFTYRVPPAGVPNTTLEDRASYYGADGRLRAADYRQLVNATNLADRTLMAFEEYRYDALGRRVLVRARRQCDFTTDRPKRQCSLDLVRRTVWDGTQELAEIQMPDGPLNGQVDQAERDMSDTERSNVEAAHKRVKEIDDQLKPLREFEALRGEHRSGADQFRATGSRERSGDQRGSDQGAERRGLGT